MSLTLTLYARIPVLELESVVRTNLHGATESAGTGAVSSTFAADKLWVSVGEYAFTRETPVGEMRFDSVLHFRLDKVALESSTRSALACVRDVLESSDGDCALYHLFDTVIFMRFKGAMRAFEYRGEQGFWSVHDPASSLGEDVQRVAVEPPRCEDEAEDSDNDGWGPGGGL